MNHKNFFQFFRVDMPATPDIIHNITKIADLRGWTPKHLCRTCRTPSVFSLPSNYCSLQQLIFSLFLQQLSIYSIS